MKIPKIQFYEIIGCLASNDRSDLAKILSESINGKKIVIYQNKKLKDDYIVIINNDVYEMDSNAGMPNGVNIYLGDIKKIPALQLGRVVTLKVAPEGLKKGIEMRVKNG